MPATTTVVANISNAVRDLTNFQQRALPYAAATALTGVALDAREELLSGMPRRFRFRTGTAWLRRHFQVTRATARNLVATLSADLDYMALHEFTGVKFPRGEHLAVPLGDLRLRKIPDNLRPRYLLGHDLGGLLQSAAYKGPRVRKKRLATYGKGYLIRAGSKVFIAIRTAKGESQILYSLVPSVKIGLDRLQMQSTVQRAVERNFPAKFSAQLDKISSRFAAEG